MTPLRVLMVDDEEDMLRTGRAILDDVRIEGADVQVETERDPQRAAERLRTEDFDVVLLDIRMPKLSGLDLLAVAKARSPAAVCVLLTAYPTVESAVAAVRTGAFDYLTKPFTAEQLELVFRRAAERRLLQTQNELLQRQRPWQAPQVAESPSMRDVLALVDRVAASESNVLITGETGTGKTLLAKRLHERGPRREQSLVHVDCGALPEGLLDGELFGHERGAYTGAAGTRRGLVEFAHGGTLFLDEVCNLSFPLQAKLLGVLQERVVRRVGANRVVPVDIRVIAATNRSPEEEVRRGRLREDLFFRLDVVRVHVPPLRERRDDILPLARTFLARFGHPRVRPIAGFTNDAERMLCEYRWPGNVRELENVVQRACALASGELLGPADLPPSLGDTGGADAGPPTGDFAAARAAHLAPFERAYFVRLLHQYEGNLTRAAAQAGLSRNTLYRYLRKLGMTSAPEGELFSAGDTAQPP